MFSGIASAVCGIAVATVDCWTRFACVVLIVAAMKIANNLLPEVIFRKVENIEYLKELDELDNS
jgi:hypothetical protein